jgi:hypothetical protein
MATDKLMSAAQFDALPEEDGRQWELLDGEIIEAQVQLRDTTTLRQNCCFH